MIIEIENAIKSLSQEANNRNPNAPYHVVRQPALMFLEGENASKYPDKFDLQLHYSTDLNKANSVMAIAVGRYRLKDSAFSVNGFNSARCDFSHLELINNK